MGPDFRILVAKARKIAQAYWKVYGEYPPTKVLVQEVAGVMQKATQSGCVSDSLCHSHFCREYRAPAVEGLNREVC